MPGLDGLPSAFAIDDRRDWRFDRGIGSEAPKLFREPLLSACEGDTLRECMRCSDSAIEDLEAGTSIAPVSFSPDGTANVLLYFAGEPLLVIF